MAADLGGWGPRGPAPTLGGPVQADHRPPGDRGLGGFASGPSPRSDRCRNNPETISPGCILPPGSCSANKPPDFTLTAMTRHARGECGTATAGGPPGPLVPHRTVGTGFAPEGPGCPGQVAPSLPLGPQPRRLALQGRGLRRPGNIFLGCPVSSRVAVPGFSRLYFPPAQVPGHPLLPHTPLSTHATSRQPVG